MRGRIWLLAAAATVVMAAPAGAVTQAQKQRDTHKAIATGGIFGHSEFSGSSWDEPVASSAGSPVASAASRGHASLARWKFKSLFGNEVASATTVTKWRTSRGRVVAHQTSCSTHTSTFWHENHRKHWKWLRRRSRGNSWCGYHFWYHIGFSWLGIHKSTRLTMGSIVNGKGQRRRWLDGGH